MTIIKCKMCGGDIVLNEEKTIGTCEYCGTQMTLPKVSDDQMAALFNRGNHFRRQGEFDKALAVYENIVREDDADAEAHWCCALCRFGIEYVEDPNTFEYIPTCHRASFESFQEDVDYKAAIEYSDGITRRQYQKDGAKIAEVQKRILATSQNEEPFDVFICYKETDDTTKERTRDSIDAQEIYYQLTQEGYRVFFSRITLEDKAGAEYEPYIFAALNSSRVMVVIGSKPEYFNAVWVQNEWSRFLAMMRKDRTKLLLPCYKGMDPYELPERLGVFQSYDMAKIGFMQDLIRGIRKILQRDKPKEMVKETVVIDAGNANVTPLLERVFIFLEDGKWQEANTYCEKVLDIAPKNAEAYLGKLMAELQVRSRRQLADCTEPFDDRESYGKVIRFGDEKLEAEMRGYIDHINERNENTRITGIYDKALSDMRVAATESAFKVAAEKFKTITGFKNADELADQCFEKAEVCRKDAVYASARSHMNGNAVSGYEAAIEAFGTITGWKDAEEQIYVCQKRIEEIREKEEADRLERERQAEERRIAAKKRKRLIMISVMIIAVCIAFVIVLTMVIIPNQQYKEAIAKYGDHIKAAFVGDTIKFGQYEQDNNSSNGKEEIEWVVLAKDGDSVLIISKYALDRQNYNLSRTGVTWENSFIREWLNGEFMKEAFNSGEQRLIRSTYVTADKNPSYDLSSGNDTTDKVFLFSIVEANKYFNTDSTRLCQGTAYCYAQGAYEESDGNCWWWLRSRGGDVNNAASVDSDGTVDNYGHLVDRDDSAVRPALWIDLGF